MSLRKLTRPSSLPVSKVTNIPHECLRQTSKSYHQASFRKSCHWWSSFPDLRAPSSPPSRFQLGTLRSDDGDGNGNAPKAISWIGKTTTMHVHHAFLYISSPSLHDYDGKMPVISCFMEDVNKLRLNFLSLSNLNRVLIPWVPEVFSRVRRGAFGGCRVGLRPTCLRPKAEETSGEAPRKNFSKKSFSRGSLIRLDRNRKPRMKSLWNPG